MTTLIPDISLTSFKNGQVPTGPTAAIVDITAEMAAQWLEKNHVNRPLRDRKIAQFKRDMLDGKWRITGEAIKFGRSGNLLDGQNRLWAIVESNCTITMFVVRGVEDDTQGVMDSGTARTAADNLAMAGYKYAQLIASVARRRLSLTDSNSVTNSEVHEYVEQNPEIVVAAELSSRHARRCDIIPSTVALAAWRIAEVHDWATSDEFFAAAADKVGLRPGDPVLAMTPLFRGYQTEAPRVGPAKSVVGHHPGLQRSPRRQDDAHRPRRVPCGWRDPDSAC